MIIGSWSSSSSSVWRERYVSHGDLTEARAVVGSACGGLCSDDRDVID